MMCDHYFEHHPSKDALVCKACGEEIPGIEIAADAIPREFGVHNFTQAAWKLIQKYRKK